MILIRSSRLTAGIAVGLGWLLACPPRADAQTFVEFGGGWNYSAPTPTGEHYGLGRNVRTSIGRQLAPNVLLRIDAFTGELDYRVLVNSPCPSFGCSGPSYLGRSVDIAGLVANGLLNIDPRGIL